VSSDDAVERERQRYRELFDSTPAALLLTDMQGLVREANRRASRLLGATGRSLAGKPLVSFVDAEHRVGFRERLARADQLQNAPPWALRIRPRGGEPVTVTVSVSVARNHGRSTGLRWLLLELPSGLRETVSLSLQPEQADGGGAGPEAEQQHELLGQSLEQVALAAFSLLRADHIGVMLLDENGAHRWVVTTGELDTAFERIREALAAGPCVEAMRRGRPVWTRDIGADSRWPALVAAVGGNEDVHGAVAASVAVEGRAVGTCVALTASARVWGESELAAMRAFAAVIGQAVLD
jgi:PAS domain S-box-containing protein